MAAWIDFDYPSFIQNSIYIAEYYSVVYYVTLWRIFDGFLQIQDYSQNYIRSDVIYYASSFG